MKENDYSKISIKDICGAAGLSRQTFYQFFNSKDDVIRFTLIKKLGYIEVTDDIRKLANILFSFIDKNTNTKSSISLKDDIYSLTRKNNYITITPTLNLSDTNNIKINLKIKGNNLDINNTYDSICSSSNYFSLKNILSENFSYIILSILIIILYILIKKLRINNKKIKNKYNNRTKVK